MNPGSRVGGYVLVKRIGAGGMGEVWLAEHVMLGRRAAIKFLHAAIAMREEIVARFFNEARAATAIADPGIVQIFDFGYAESSPYIVMELLVGETLDERCRRTGSVPIVDALRLLRQVAGSLGAAHERGIVHRDLKPENIFIVPDAEVAGGERAKIVDFGIAKLTGDTGIKTQTSAVMGTPTFMSPEQCRGAGGVDQRSDIYSLGCVLFALVAGRPPFVGEGAGDLLVAHMREAAPRASSVNPSVPPAVDALIARCLEKDPARRFASGSELAAAIDAVRALAAQQTVMAPQPFYASSPTTLSGAASVIDRPTLPRARWALPAALAIIVVGGGAVFAVTRGGDTSTVAAAQPLEALPVEPAHAFPDAAPAAVTDAATHAAADAPTDAAPGTATGTPTDAPIDPATEAQRLTDAAADTPTDAQSGRVVAPVVDAGASRPPPRTRARPSTRDTAPSSSSKPTTIDDFGRSLPQR